MRNEDIVALAETHAGKSGNASAQLACQDAKSCLERGLRQYARQRALASLRHSVGIFHHDYKRAIEHELND